MSTRQTAIVLLLSTAASTATAQSLMLTHGEVVQAVGDPVPGQPGVLVGGTSPFNQPVMDLNGNMVWRAKLTGAGITTNGNDQALFYGRTADDLVLLLQRGNAEPSGTLGTGVTLNYSATGGWEQPRISPTGTFLMIGSLLAGTSGTTDDTCVFHGQAGSLQVLVREGDSAPTGGSTINTNYSGTGATWQGTCLNSQGMALVRADLTGGDAVANVSDDAWIIGTPGNMQWMCREGDLFAIPAGTVAVGNLGGKPQMDELGRVLHDQQLSTTLGTAPVTTADDSVLLLYIPGFGQSLVAREGELAPGTPGCAYGTLNLSAHSFSRTTGQIVFTTSMTGGNVTGNTNDTAIFAGTAGVPFTLVARESETAPTGVPGEIYQALFTGNTAAVNDSGAVCFAAQLGPVGNPGLTTFNDVGIFYGTPGNIQLIMREGQAIPGLPAGWVIGNTGGGGMSSSATFPMLNERGQVLVSVAGVMDGGTMTGGDPAQVLWDPTLGLQASIRGGETYTIAASAQVHTNHGTVANSSGDGGGLSFNNNGDQCSRMFFTGTVPTAVLRNHVGSLIATPASISTATGGTQSFTIDCSSAYGFQIYALIGSQSGTRLGTPSPLGPQLIPLNFDGWTQLSLDFANSAVYTNSLWFTDANGRSTASFNLPAVGPGLQGLLLHHAVVTLDFSLASTFVTEPTSLRLY